MIPGVCYWMAHCSVVPLYLCHFSSLCHQAAAASGGSVTIKGKSRQRSRVITIVANTDTRPGKYKYTVLLPNTILANTDTHTVNYKYTVPSPNMIFANADTRPVKYKYTVSLETNFYKKCPQQKVLFANRNSKIQYQAQIQILMKQDPFE